MMRYMAMRESVFESWKQHVIPGDERIENETRDTSCDHICFGYEAE
jgi:hypothetical protein